MGDSLTHGYGLPQEQGFVPQLEQWLRSRGHEVTIVNAGVSGDTSAGGLARAEWTLTPDIDALIVELGGNDVLRGLPPESTRSNIEGILSIAQAKGVDVLLAGLPAPTNYGPEYKQSFDAIFPDLAAAYGTLLRENFLAALSALPDRAAVRRDYIQPDGIHPNAAGVKLVVEDIGPAVEALIARAAGDS